MAAKSDASYDLSRARACVTGQTTIAASTATTSLPNGRIVTRGCPAPTQWRSVKSCPTSPSNPSAAVGTPSVWLPSRSRHRPPPRRSDRCGLSVSQSAHLPAGHQCADRAPRQYPHDRQPDRGLGGATIRKASHRREPFGCHCRPGTHWNWRSRRPTSGRIPCRKDQEGSTDRGGFRRASGQTGAF